MLVSSNIVGIHRRLWYSHEYCSKLDQVVKRDLEAKQIQRALIASAADGARKESLQLQRS